MIPKKYHPKNHGYPRQLKDKILAALSGDNPKLELLKLSGKYGTTIGAAYTSVMKEIQKDVGKNNRSRSAHVTTGTDHS